MFSVIPSAILQKWPANLPGVAGHFATAMGLSYPQRLGPFPAEPVGEHVHISMIVWRTWRIAMAGLRFIQLTSFFSLVFLPNESNISRLGTFVKK